jgi:hypothetical protein
MEYLLKSSFIGGIEVFLTHPLEYMKTQYQAKNNIKSINFTTHTYFQSLMPRLYSVIPMRTIFWSSLNYHKEMNYSVLYNTIITSKLQTLIDFPSEQIKTRKMLCPNISIFDCFNRKYILEGYACNYFRNGIFLYYYLFFTNKEQNISNTIAGSMLGIALSQPFDYMKTRYQSNQQVLFDKTFVRKFYKGLILRCSISTTGMLIGTLASKYL